MPSTRTAAPGWNPLPVIFTGVLPPVDPVSGNMPATAGAGVCDMSVAAGIGVGPAGELVPPQAAVISARAAKAPMSVREKARVVILVSYVR
jgi:hypothetical protein